MAGRNNNLPIQREDPESLKDQPSPFNAALAQNKLRDSLANLNLAVEMLESVTKGTEMELYFGVIMRNSTRINYLVNELLLDEQANKKI